MKQRKNENIIKSNSIAPTKRRCNYKSTQYFKQKILVLVLFLNRNYHHKAQTTSIFKCFQGDVYTKTILQNEF